MNRDKQIEFERGEISEIIAKNFKYNDEQYDASDFEWSAYQVQMAGYRKASEVAREIIEEIEAEIEAALKSNYNARANYIGSLNTFIPMVEGKIFALRGIDDFIAELKKKYTEEVK